MPTINYFQSNITQNRLPNHHLMLWNNSKQPKCDVKTNVNIFVINVSQTTYIKPTTNTTTSFNFGTYAFWNEIVCLLSHTHQTTQCIFQDARPIYFTPPKTTQFGLARTLSTSYCEWDTCRILACTYNTGNSSFHMHGTVAVLFLQLYFCTGTHVVDSTLSNFFLMDEINTNPNHRLVFYILALQIATVRCGLTKTWPQGYKTASRLQADSLVCNYLLICAVWIACDSDAEWTASLTRPGIDVIQCVVLC